MGQRSKIGWKRPRQSVADVSPHPLVPPTKAQASDAAVLVRLDPVPVPERRLAQPVGVVRPAVPAGGAVDRLKRCPVRLRASLRPNVPAPDAQADGESERGKGPHVYDTREVRVISGPLPPASTPGYSPGPRPGTSIWRSCAACTDSGPSRAARRVSSSSSSTKKRRRRSRTRMAKVKGAGLNWTSRASLGRDAGLGAHVWSSHSAHRRRSSAFCALAYPCSAAMRYHRTASTRSRRTP